MTLRLTRRQAVFAASATLVPTAGLAAPREITWDDLIPPVCPMARLSGTGIWISPGISGSRNTMKMPGF